MATSDLDFLLVQYEQKRRNAEIDLEQRKKQIYQKNPRLEEIEEQINKIAIHKTKSNYEMLRRRFINAINSTN